MALGCPIEPEEWEKENRAPLFPGKVQRWILARTLRDRPSPADLQNTLVAVMNKWFGESPVDPAISLPFDPEFSRAGSTDAIVIRSAGPAETILPNTVKRREHLTHVPTVNGEGGVIFLTITFNYRGFNKERPWPVHTAPGLLGGLDSTRRCPIGADWMLVSVSSPDAEAPPKREISEAVKKEAEKAVEKVSDGVVKPVLKEPIENLLFWFIGAAAVVAGGIYLVRSSASSDRIH